MAKASGGRNLDGTVCQNAGRYAGRQIDATKTNPAVLAQWCFATAQFVNAFYRDVPVMDAEGDVRLRRLALATAAKRALTNGLAFLTIAVPERM